jgi:sec-independent protein translocase protein TatB
MELFNIGPLEFILIILLAVVILGPERMVKGAYSAGRWINKFVRSPMWKEIMSTSQDIRELPTKIIRETGIEESINEIKQTTQDVTTELNTTLREANDEVKQAVNEANAEVRQATTELNDTANQALKDTSQEVEKISNPDDTWTVPEIDEGWNYPKTNKTAAAESNETLNIETVDGEPVDAGEPQPVDLPETQPDSSPDDKGEGDANAPSASTLEPQPAPIVGVAVGMPVLPVTDKDVLRPVPVLSHLQEVLPEILPAKPSTPLTPETVPPQPVQELAIKDDGSSPEALEQQYEAKLNLVLEQYEGELKKILEQYKADLKKAAPPVEEASPPVETAVQEKLE